MPPINAPPQIRTAVRFFFCVLGDLFTVYTYLKFRKARNPIYDVKMGWKLFQVRKISISILIFYKKRRVLQLVVVVIIIITITIIMIIICIAVLVARVIHRRLMCETNALFSPTVNHFPLCCCCCWVLQHFHFSLLVVVFLVSGGVAMLFSGQSSDHQEEYPIEGFLLTLLSGMLAGLKWTMSQVRHKKNVDREILL